MSDDQRERARRGKKKSPLSGGLKACEKLLGELFSKKHSEYAFVFYAPVDVKTLPDYNDKIAIPMDMTTIKKKLQDREYSSVKEFKGDLLLIIENCKKYNDDGDEIIEMALKFQTVVIERMAEIESCFFETPVGDASTQDGVKGPPAPAPKAKKVTNASDNKNGRKRALKLPSKAGETDKVEYPQKKAKNSTGSQASEGTKTIESSAQNSGDKGVSTTAGSSTPVTKIPVDYVPLPKSSLKTNNASAGGKSSPKSLVHDAEDEEFSTKIPVEYVPLPKSSKNASAGGKSSLKSSVNDADDDGFSITAGSSTPVTKAVREKLSLLKKTDLEKKAKGKKRTDNDVASSSSHLIKNTETPIVEFPDDSNTDDNNWVIVKNITEECTEEMLTLKFRTYGKIMQLITDPMHESAMIQYEDHTSVEKVLSAKSIKFRNKQVSVEEREMPTIEDMDTNNKESGEISVELNRVYDVDQLKVVLSDDQSRPIDERLMEALESINFDLAKCCIEKEKKFLEYLRETMACDTPIILAGVNSAVGYKMKGAEVVVGEGNGHICLVNRWEMAIGCKGINKSGGFSKVMNVLLEMENEDIAAKKEQFKKEKEAEALLEDMAEFEFTGPNGEDFADSEAQTSPETTPKKHTNESEKTPKKSSKVGRKKGSGSSSSGSSKKPSYFLEQLYRNIMQGGTAPGLLATMYHAKEKDFYLNFDEGSMLLDLLYTSGCGLQGAKRTEFCTYLLSFFTSRESRSVKVSTGPLVVQDASLQIFAACQPQIMIDAFLKDPRDAAGLFDRFSYCYVSRVNIPLRQQKQNVDNLERVNIDIKKLLRTVESLHAPDISGDVALTHHKWFFDEDAMELVFKFDELLSQQDQGNPMLMALNAKGRMKMYSGAAINACKRQALEIMLGDSDSLSKMDKRKIITKEDVLKSIYLVFQSNFIFLQLNATTGDPGSKPLKQKQKPVDVGRNKPAGKGGAFVVNLEDYEKDITDVVKAYEKVYKIYKLAGKVCDGDNDQVISFDALLDERTFIRAPSNSKFSEKECLVYFLRCLGYNGIGRLLMNGAMDAKDQTTFTNKEYSNMTFVLHKENNLNDGAKKFLNTMVVAMKKSDPEFSPFNDK